MPIDILIMNTIDLIRIHADELADSKVRRAIDERCTEIFLLARDGHLNNMNGGKGPEPRNPTGTPIGLNDKHGNPVHIGDTLRFDPYEWGNSTNNEFVVTLVEGEIQMNGGPSDIPSWCEIIKRWNED